jgi:membrane protease YdiL (CAAX protease family)
MPRARDASAARGETLSASALAGYWSAARRPLHILAFLLPLVIAYELCLALFLPLDVKAHKGLLEFLAALGVPPTGGLYLGGVLIILILLAWHLLLNERWRVDPGVLAVMAVESVILTLPLLALRLVLSGSGDVALSAAAGGGSPASIDELGRFSRLAISVGAGLYEELLFRWILIAVLHTLLVDVGKLPHAAGAVIAIVASAAAFTWYHDLSGASHELVLFVFLAGVYLAALFVFRGFGIVVAVHALYNTAIALLSG